PGQINYTSAATGSSSHLAAELFKAMAHVDLVRVPYKNVSVQMADLLGGQVQLTFGTTPTVMPHVTAGKLRPLAVSSAQPSTLVPGLPTIAASGLPGYESVSMAGLFAPAKTPEPVVQRLNQDVVRVLNGAAVREKFLATGAEPVGTSSEQLTTTIKSEVARL